MPSPKKSKKGLIIALSAVLLLILTALTLFFTIAYPKIQQNKLFEQAESLYQSGELTKAVELYQESNHPDEAQKVQEEIDAARTMKGLIRELSDLYDNLSADGVFSYLNLCSELEDIVEKIQAVDTKNSPALASYVTSIDNHLEAILTYIQIDRDYFTTFSSYNTALETAAVTSGLGYLENSIQGILEEPFPAKYTNI